MQGAGSINTPLAMSVSQASLAAAVLASTVGSYIALRPPNQNAEASPSTGDSIHALKLTNRHFPKVGMAPLGLLAVHTSSLACLYPNISQPILRHGLENGLNPDLITWSTATSVPLVLILCAGIPLRLVAYSSLGRNFTFALRQPDRLTTTGVYRYVQHPSYTGLVIVIVSNLALLFRTDGALSCWVPRQWYRAFRIWQFAMAPVGLSLLVLSMWTRVSQEERMLRAKFGVEWENWHARTPRFLPWIF